MEKNRSRIGLNLLNFLLAEVVGVVMPFTAVFLKQHHWNYSQIGVATAIAGLGTLLMQIPAGLIADRFENRRLLIGLASLLLGASYGLLPLFADHVWWVDPLLFMSGAVGAFFVPLLASLAISLVGHQNLDRTMGENQSWNHAGNITAALGALIFVKFLGITSIFFTVAAISFLAAGSVLIIRKDDLSSVESKENIKATGIKEILRDPCIRTLLISVALFHIANAPVMPLVGLYLKHLGGGDDQIAWVVMVAQAVMIPVAWLAGKFCGTRGRKPIFAIAFIVLPIRILLYALTTHPSTLLAIQVLDGIGAGIYGVVIALICSDLTRKKGGFNTVMALAQTALALGGVVGPLLQGYVTERLGFPLTFVMLAAIALVGALIFIVRMPETKEDAGTAESVKSCG